MHLACLDHCSFLELQVVMVAMVVMFDRLECDTLQQHDSHPGKQDKLVFRHGTCTQSNTQRGTSACKPV
jgi:hypothetical protein